MVTRRVTIWPMAEKRRVFTPTYIRQWRQKRDLTLDQVKERMWHLHEIAITKTSLSRIELGKQPYSQPILEALADVLETDPASLLMRDPTGPDAIWSIWDRISPPKRNDALRILDALADPAKKKSGGG